MGTRLDFMNDCITINPALPLWQRGLTKVCSTANGFYGPDRMALRSFNQVGVAETNLTVSQQVGGPNGTPFFARISLGAVSTRFAFQQRIEASVMRRFKAGDYVSLSVYVKRPAGVTVSNASVKLISEAPTTLHTFGEVSAVGANGTILGSQTYNSLSDTVFNRLDQFVQVTENMRAFGFSFKVQGITDTEAVAGFNGNVLEFGGFMVVPGKNPLTYVGTRSESVEAFLSQRYFEKSYDLDVTPATATTSCLIVRRYQPTNANTLLFDIPFRVTKRTAPILVFYDSSGNINKVGIFDQVTDPNNSGTPVTNTNGSTFFSMSPGISSSGVRFHYTADAEL